jgi:dihydrolipoamide dehydrogenase
MALIELKVPDIGDFDEVEVIELLVAAGDAVKLEQSLLTVESEKASMEIPSSATGRIVELKVGLGDKVAQGSVIALVETVADLADVAEVTQSAPPAAAASVSATATAAAPIAPLAAERVSGSVPAAAGAYAGQVDLSCRLLVLGAGPGGYSAAFRAADLGLDTILVERYPTLGGVCLNVGCIPSKALLHTAAVIDEARALAAHGITFGEPRIDLDALRASKDKVVSKLTQGLAGMARARKVRVIRGYGRFIDAHHLEVETTEGDGQTRTGARQVIHFEQAIIAAGSQSVRLPFLPDDPRIVDSTGALKLATRPGRMLVIGGGIIGLEMGTVYSTLGARLDVVEMLDGLMQGADRDLVKVWQRHNGHRFDRIMLKTRTVRAEATPQGIMVWFEGDQAPAEPQCYDLVLSAVGRRPNGLSIGADVAGVAIGERGFIAVDKQMRTNVSHIFAIGDIVGQPMLAHKAVHEGHVAAEAAAGEKSFFDARVIPSVAYTDPEIAWVGLTEEQAGAQGLKIAKSTFPWSASGRAIANGRDEGFTKLIFDQASHRLLGGAIVGTHAGDMIGELALAIEMGADATDIGRTIHPHPTLGETIGMAAELFEGVCTDLPPASRRH